MPGISTVLVYRGSASKFVAAVFLLVVPCLAAGAACSPPAEIEARLKAHPTSENYAGLGNWFADRKEFECAAEAFASASRLQPTSATLAYLWGLSLFSAGEDEKALAPLNQAAGIDPNDIRPHLVLGALLDRMKKTTESEAEWRAALAIDPDSTTALDSLSQEMVDEKDYAGVFALLDRPGTSSTRTAQQSLNLGLACVGTGQLELAIKVLREGLNDNPASAPIANQLALVLMLHGRDEEAFAVLNLAIAKHPDDVATEVLYLRTLVSSHSAKAAEFARKLLAANPDQWEVLYLSALLESEEGDFATARTHLERSIALNPNYYQTHAELGNVLTKANELPGAREQLEKAIALGDNEPEVQYNLAMVLKRQGDAAGAQETLRVYQRLKEARSGRVQAAGKSEEADQAMAAGDAAQAATLYRQALEDDPEEAILWYKLSRALDKRKDVDGEKAALQKAIALNPKLAEALNQMGYLAVHEDNPAQAESYFRAAVQASPSYVAAWVNLAATLASEAKWDEAQKAVAQALTVDPDNAAARQLSQALTEPHPAS
jgi:tetratricopeptide (TPR) repeat protein